MAYSAIPDEELAGNKPILSTTAIKLRDNTDDHTHTGGAGGTLAADSVGQTQISASAVGQGELKTALQQATTTTALSITYTGGGYTLNAGLSHSANYKGSSAAGDFSASYVWGVRLTSDLTGTSFWQSRYITASKPYDLGNGEIELFMYAIINSSGVIESISTSPDPAWAYNGSNAIDPRKRYKKKGNPNYFYMKKTRPNKAANFAAWRASYENPVISVETEITQAVKNQDMNQVPHPFMGNDLTGKTVVMIDPVSDLCGCLFEMHEEGEDVHDIIRNYLNVQNTPIAGAKTPNGVMTVRATWK